MDIAHRFTAAFATRDPRQVIEVFTPDAVYRDLFYGEFTGHDGLTALFERVYREGERHEWVMTNVVAAPERTIGEWEFTFTVSAAVRQGAGRTLRFGGVSVFDTRDDRCCAYREYFDRGAALHALGIPAGAVARIVQRRPTVLMDGMLPA